MNNRIELPNYEENMRKVRYEVQSLEDTIAIKIVELSTYDWYRYRNLLCYDNQGYRRQPYDIYYRKSNGIQEFMESAEESDKLRNSFIKYKDLALYGELQEADYTHVRALPKLMREALDSKITKLSLVEFRKGEMLYQTIEKTFLAEYPDASIEDMTREFMEDIFLQIVNGDYNKFDWEEVFDFYKDTYISFVQEVYRL